MISEINFSNIFTSELSDYYDRYKNNNGSIKKYFLQRRFEALIQFLYNSSYWSRFNKCPLTGKWLKNCITGKYLNELHLFLIKFGFYRSLYMHILSIYLRITNYKTLENISIDSTFIRNVLGKKLSRNPEHHNKPGLKNHTLVDSNRVPISLFITDCNVHDSVVVQKLIQNIFIDKDIFSKHCSNFLADSAYSGFITLEYITSIGLNIIVGRNKQHVKKIIIKRPTNTQNHNLYKKRGIVENFFGNLLRIPCLVNNYQKTLESYQGLCLLYMSVYLAKKINKIIRKNNNARYAEEEKDKLEKFKLWQEKRKIILRNVKKRKKEFNEIENIQRKRILTIKAKRIKKNIWSNINVRQLAEIYKRMNIDYHKNKVIKKGRTKDTSYNKYEEYMKESIYNYVKNNVLINTEYYVFANKTLYYSTAKSGIFLKQNIKRYMNDHNFNNIIQKFSSDFFT